MSVRPIKLISGKSPFCETRFDDVRVPVANVIGEIDGGWSVAKALLGFERNMIADTFGASRGGDSARAAAAGSRSSRASTGSAARAARSTDAVLRDEIAQLEMDERAFAPDHPAQPRRGARPVISPVPRARSSSSTAPS